MKYELRYWTGLVGIAFLVGSTACSSPQGGDSVEASTSALAPSACDGVDLHWSLADFEFSGDDLLVSHIRSQLVQHNESTPCPEVTVEWMLYSEYSSYSDPEVLAAGSYTDWMNPNEVSEWHWYPGFSSEGRDTWLHPFFAVKVNGVARLKDWYVTSLVEGNIEMQDPHR